MKIGQQTGPTNNPSIQGTQSSNKTEKLSRTDVTTEAKPAGSAASPAAAEISTRAKEFAKAKQVATEAPDVREEKIAELKRRIASGQYNVKPEAIADRMVDEHVKTMGKIS